MKRFRFRISTLMLLILIVALTVALVKQSIDARRSQALVSRFQAQAELERQKAENHEAQARAAVVRFQQAVNRTSAGTGK